MTPARRPAIGSAHAGLGLDAQGRVVLDKPLPPEQAKEIDVANRRVYLQARAERLERRRQKKDDPAHSFKGLPLPQ